MVSTGTFIGLSISIGLVIIVPIILLFIFKKKYQISLKVFFFGMLTFFIFASVLEGIAHAYFLTLNETTKTALENPWIFMAYGGLMAGLFEETGRYIMMRFALKNHRGWEDGLSFGLGHGTLEALLIVGLSNATLLVYANMINKGVFTALFVNEQAKAALEPIQEQLTQAPSYMFALSGMERMSAIAIHIGLSIIVLYAIRTKKIAYLFVAILLHATINIPAGLFQTGVVSNIVLVEIMIAFLAVVAIVWTVKSKKLFENISH